MAKVNESAPRHMAYTECVEQYARHQWGRPAAEQDVMGDHADCIAACLARMTLALESIARRLAEAFPTDEEQLFKKSQSTQAERLTKWRKCRAEAMAKFAGLTGLASVASYFLLDHLDIPHPAHAANFDYDKALKRVKTAQLPKVMFTAGSKRAVRYQSWLATQKEQG